MTSQIHQVIALHRTGQTSIWHVDADDVEEARLKVHLAVLKIDPKKTPVVVLAVVPKGQKYDDLPATK